MRACVKEKQGHDVSGLVFGTYLVADDAADLAEGAALVLLGRYPADLAREQDVRGNDFLSRTDLQVKRHK